jgi:AcrR family transcriptional regulator
MSKRELARLETRQRIVDATARLHGERGVLGTSWKDIAREADVSVATVYAHFPSLDELLPACGALVMERVRPPTLDTLAEALKGSESADERLEAVARELFGFYERGGPHIEVDVRERELPGMREWEDHLLDMVTSFLRRALAGEKVDARTIRLMSAFFDLPTFKALRVRGVAPAKAATTVAMIASGLLAERRRT